MQLESLFNKIYNSATEADLDTIIATIENNENVAWHPYGDSESFFGVIENQQASAVPALIEKITNSIDAILMKLCYELGIDPKSDNAPKNIDEAIKKFFPQSSNWDLSGPRGLQAESIQILASGPRKNTSLTIYDDGEGQHPENFKNSFLSLLRGNKNEIAFVQGKYNMGGSGAIVFCGKKRYQLVASKRYDNRGKFGFTLVRKHPLTKTEEQTKKNTWYEYLLINGEIPSFAIDTLDLGLHKRPFKTGTIIKMYSYDLPTGARSVISRDLNQSINEYLFQPALPIYTIDNKERYPKDLNLERHLYGLKKRLEEDNNKYIKTHFSERYEDKEIGSLEIQVYIFNPKIADKNIKDSKEAIRREFFKNNMSVLFSQNGQVHGSDNSGFITKSLKFNLLKDYLLIHVDCSQLKTNFRSELFMASRDRLKKAEESTKLKAIVKKILIKSKLKEIYKEWKDSITVQAESSNDLLKEFGKNIPFSPELRKILDNTFKIEQQDTKQNKEKAAKNKVKNKAEQKTKPFNPERFPAKFDIDLKAKDENNIPLTKIPLGGEKTIKFSTDVEDQYFDRSDEPGELQIATLETTTNKSKGGTEVGEPKDIETLIDVNVSSPNKGSIRVNLAPSKEVEVGDAIKISATLTSPNGDIEQIFMVQITDKEKPPQKIPEPKKQPDDNIGLPKLIQVFETKKENFSCWNELQLPVDFDHNTIIYPLVEGEQLDAIYLNMDSKVLKNYKATLKSEEQIIAADKRYVSTIYFHTLFLYMINKNKKYQIKQQQTNVHNEDAEDVDLTDYLTAIFSSHYADFLLHFEMSTLIDSLAD